MTLMPRCALLPALLAATLAPAQPQWTYELPSRDVAATGFTLEALDPQRLLVRNTGQPAAVIDDRGQLLQLGSPLVSAGTGTRILADGSLLQLVPSGFDPACRVQRLDAQLQLHWTSDLRSTAPSSGTRCGALDVDGRGQLWASDGALLRLSVPDGVKRLEVGSVLPDLGEVVDLVANPAAEGGVYALTLRDGRSTVSHVGSEGQLRWRWSEPDAAISLGRIVRSARGDLILLGQISAGNNLSGRVVVLDAAGQQRWRYTGQPDQTHSFAVSADGRVLGYAASFVLPRGPSQLFLLDANGGERWRQERPLDTGSLRAFGEVQIDELGGVLLSERQLIPGGDIDRLEKFDGAGNAQWRITLPQPHQARQLRPDGTVVALDLERQLLRYAANDGSLTTGSLPRSVELAQTYTFDAALDTEGRLAIVAGDQEASSVELLDAEGRPLWRSTDPSVRFDRVALPSADRVCTAQVDFGLARLACRRANDAQVVWQKDFDFGVDPARVLAFQGRPDGSVAAVLAPASIFGPASGAPPQKAAPVLTQLVVLDATGQVTLRREFQASPTAAYFAPDGSLLNLSRGPFGRTEVIAPDGTQRFALDRLALGLGEDGEVLTGRPLNGGQSLLMVRRGADTQLQLLDASGQQVWRRNLPESLAATGFRAIEIAGDLVLANDTPQTVGARNLAGIVRLRRDDGALVWQRSAPHYSQIGCSMTIALSSNGQQLAFVATLRDSVEVQVVDVVDGRLLNQRSLPADRVVKSVGSRLNAAGQLRTFGVDENGPGAKALVNAFGGLFDPVADDQGVGRVARSGAWYDVSSAGQGWFLDVIPSSRTLYAAWFTYETGESVFDNAPARLRWYSLQGQYGDASDRDITLDILENRDGVFAAPPVTTARKVGTATLRFDGCGSAILDYAFDVGENGGRADRTGWRALAIRDPSCATTPTELLGGGFSSAASGAWFDPANAGQGVVGVVQPPSATQPGLLFAGWFHYDPAGRADDPRAQAWLTFQGELPTSASGGTAEVGIFRTLGGTLGGPATRNTLRIGTASIRFDGCNRMTLAYRFDAGVDLAPYAGVVGSQTLQKLGGCVRP